MKRLLAVLIVLALLGASLAAWLEPGGRLRGYFHGEPFYRGRPASWWARQIHSDDSATQAQALAQLREGKDTAVPLVATLLEKKAGSGWEESASRWRAAELLGEIGAGSESAVAALCAAVQDDDPLVRPVAIRSLGRLS
jgi:HEAT repeat protein